MLTREESTQPDGGKAPSNDIREGLDMAVRVHAERVGSVMACFESLQSTLRIIMLAVVQDELSQDDIHALHDQVMLCMRYSDIGSARYLLEGGSRRAG